MTAVALPDQTDGRRWVLCFFTVAAAHLGIAATMMMHWPIAVEQPAPSTAIMIELAPVPTAPAIDSSEIPPGPQQVESPPPPPEPEPEPEPELEKIEEPPPKKPEVVLPQPPPPKPRMKRKPPPEPVREVEPRKEPEPKPQPPAPATTAPPSAPATPAPVAAAPQPSASSVQSLNAIQTWRSLLLAHLERHKRYPRRARWRRQEGVVHLRFTMDREGHVLAAQIARSSGHDTLDEEVLALIRRAQPLPKPPSELPGESLEFVVPVQFFLR